MPKDTFGQTEIATLSGGRIDPFNPDPSMIDMHAIAVSMSNTCRYLGYVSSFYSTAQHSTIMSYVAEDMHEGTAPEIAKAALLHDAAETWIGEVVRPIRRRWTHYDDIEDRIARMIFAVHGLDPDLWNCEEIAELDDIMLNTEIRDIKPMMDPLDPRICLPAQEVTINPQMPPAAFDNFKLRYNALFPDMRFVGGYYSSV